MTFHRCLLKAGNIINVVDKIFKYLHVRDLDGVQVHKEYNSLWKQMQVGAPFLYMNEAAVLSLCHCLYPEACSLLRRVFRQPAALA